METNQITIIGIAVSAIALILTITLNLDKETGYLIISGLFISTGIICLILLINVIYKLIYKNISLKEDTSIHNITITPINIGIIQMMIALLIVMIITKQYKYLYLSPQIASQWLLAFTIKNYQTSFFIAPIHYALMVICGVFYNNIYICIIGTIMQIIACIFEIKRTNSINK